MRASFAIEVADEFSGMVRVMDEFVKLLRAREYWLMERVLGFARKNGYTRYSSTLVEAWRISVAGLTEAMAAALAGKGDGLQDIGVDTEWNADPASRFAIVQARRHRQRGIPMEMFLGLFMYYRQAYRELVKEFVSPADERAKLDDVVVSLFDRMTIAFCSEWTDAGDQQTMAEMASTLRGMTNEKNLYLTFFESLSTPAIFLQHDGSIGNLNSAAASLLAPDSPTGKSYYASDEESSFCVFRGRQLETVFPWLGGLLDPALASAARTFEADVIQPLGFGDKHFRAVLNRHPDVSGRVTGFSLILHDQTDRMSAQEQIRNAKEELDRTFDAISDLVFLVDGNLTVLRVNKALCIRLGCSCSEIIGRRCTEVLGTSNYDFCAVDSSDGRLPVTFENIAGSFLVNRDAIRGPDGSTSGAVFVVRDVTVLECIRGTLQDIEGKYKNIFENAPVGIFQVSPHGLLSANMALASIFGFESPGEMRSYFNDIPNQLYVHLEDRQELLKEATSTGFINDRDIQLRRKGGAPFWARLSGRAVLEEDGGIEYCEGFLQDVTDLRTFVDRLSQSEREFRGLAETMHQGLVQIDGTGRVTFCNLHFCDLIKRRAEEVLGEQLANLVHPNDRDAYLAIVDVVGRGDEIRRCDIRWLTVDAQVFSIVTPVMMDGPVDERSGVWLLVMDVTQRRLMEAQLLQNQKMEAIGQLAAGIAHEINTPTQYVLNYAWFIKEAIEHITLAFAEHGNLFGRLEADSALAGEISTVRAADEKLQIPFYLNELPAAVDDVLHGLDKITAIVGSVKQFVHPGHDGMVDVDLNRLVTDTVNLSRNEWKYVADLSMDLDPEMPPVPCLSQEIGQVLLNLLVNAAHAVAAARCGDEGPRGRIHVATRRDGGWVEILISDTGVGIPEDVQKRMFEPFFTTKPVGTGTGQGLFIAHRIVTGSHGGVISCESEPGRGTSFTVRLPLEESNVGMHREAPSTESADMRGIRR